jgi:hypothetical protein
MNSWENVEAAQQSSAPTFQGHSPRCSDQGRGSEHGSQASSQHHFPILPATAKDAEEWGYQCTFNAEKPATKLVQKFNQGGGGLDCQVRTCLPNKTAVLVDVGAVGNLAGDIWVKELAVKAQQSGRKPEQIKRARGLKVAGVGTGSQTCGYDVHLPCAISTTDGGIVKGTFITPTVPNSSLPALLGLQSLKNSRAVIDTNNSKVYFLGPGDYNLEATLPPGTRAIQCEHAPSGHMMMPVDSFNELDRLESQGGLVIRETVLPVTHASSSS